MRFIYSVFLYLAAPLLMVYLWLRGRKNSGYRSRWSERLALSDVTQSDVLFHCVSMGETLAALPHIKKLLTEHPKITICVTCSSPSGSKLIQQHLGHRVNHLYLPFDFYFAMNRFLKALQPKLCIIMETELWPNMLAILASKKVPVFLCNARLSAKQQSNYKKYARLMLPMFRSLAQVQAQTEIERERFHCLGVPEDKIIVTGSAKFDISVSDIMKHYVEQQKITFGDRPVWVAGSVHPQEFEAICLAHRHLLASYPDLLLVIAPRHPEQFLSCAQTVTENQLELSRYSDLPEDLNSTQVIVLDSMGQLKWMYGVAKFVFIGGSLIPRGGHNPLEAAAFHLPLLMGPYVDNFLDICMKLNKQGGLFYVDSYEDIVQQGLQVLTNPEYATEIGNSSRKVLEKNQGAACKQYGLIESQLLKLGLIASD